MNKNIYVLCKPLYKGAVLWEVMGIYDSFTQAFKSHTKENQFIGIMTMNSLLPNKFEEWGSYRYICDCDLIGEDIFVTVI